ADGDWHANNVTLSCTATDTGSGLAHPLTDASFTLTTSVAAGEESADASTNSRSICDVAGNCTTAVVTGNKIDRKAPSFSCALPDTLWHAANVALGCTASDGGSGLANGTDDASFSLMTSIGAGVETANASTGSRNLCDALGNCRLAGPIAGNMIDR